MWCCNPEQLLCDVLKDGSALKMKAWQFLETLQNTGVLTQCYMSKDSNVLRRDAVMSSECFILLWRIVVLWKWDIAVLHSARNWSTNDSVSHPRRLESSVALLWEPQGLHYRYTGCPRRNVPDFGRVFLMLKYTDITQNTYIQSWTVMEIMTREVWKFDSCYTLIDYQIHIKTGRNMLFL